LKRRSYAKNTAIVLTTVVLLTACGSSGKNKNARSLKRVDRLLDRIEAVHVNSELSMERMHDAMDTLYLLASPDFQGDAVEVYSQYVLAVDESEDQAEDLRDAFDDMQSSSEVVFDQWAVDLQSFSNAKMRQRSRKRLETTRERYDAIEDAIEPAQSAFDILNICLRDQAVFLGNDLNRDALAAVGEELRAMSKLVSELDGRFDSAQAAAEAYIASRSLPGQLEVVGADKDDAPRPTTKKKRQGNGKKRTGGKKAAGGGGS
jgi:hypothetical protein